MKISLIKKMTAAVIAMATVVSAIPSYTQSATALNLNDVIVTSAGTMARASTSSVTVTESAGYQEGAYVQWTAVSGAEGYNVYCDGTQIDTMLVRQYSSYFRADAVGITAGSHTIKIVPVIGGSADTSKAAEVQVTAEAHDRSGYAFVNGKAMGAYNADGTLKSGAVVVYVTEATKDSVSATIGGTSATGVQNIITAAKKASTPLCIRFIGNITDPSTLEKGDLLVDASTGGLTLEGIGSDATLNGFGVRIKNSSYVEVRNLGFMNCDSDEGDNLGLQQGNTYCWVHNCDFFYGDAGSDADQVKGDGALDTKKSQYITHSYNHFWDNGKCNLQGANSSDTSNYITYHHNWYDHSDSRHPRVRVATVHVYNNYYDGNAKYGIGSTTDSDIFVENNYFRNCYKPMIISTQGSDTESTLSGEAGGMIKAYGNVIVGAASYKPYSTNSSDFDCYDASSRTEQVPSSVAAANGGATYSNFDTASDMYSYTVDAAEDVPAIVEAKAGRVNGGDFQWDFDDSTEDTNSEVITALKSALVSYDDTIVAIGSGFTDSTTPAQTTTASTTALSQTTTAATTNNGGTVTAGDYVHNFTENGTTSTFYTISGNLSTAKGTVSYNGLTLTQCLKMESATSITFSGSGTLTLVFAEASKTVKIDGTKYTTDANGIVTVTLSAGSHEILKGDSINLFYMSLSGTGETVSTTATTASGGTTQTTTQTTAGQVITPDIDVDGDLAVVSVGGWNEMAYMVVSGANDASVTGVSYSGPVSGTLTGQDFEYLVRDTDSGVRVDIPGLTAGTYSLTMDTSKGSVTVSNVVVGEQDRSGYAHFNYTEGVGAYNDNGTLKDNAIVLYVTDSNKNSVTVTSKDGTTVTGIGNILNSVGQDVGTGATSNGGTPNTNQGIIKKLAEDGTPLVVRIIGNVTAPDGLTEYDSVNYGGSVGDNGYMARIKSGLNITIEGMGTDATINGWGLHFMSESSAPEFGKSFEVRNIAFRNVPEDCIGMEGVQESSTLSAPVERCWIHNCEFYKPTIENPAESDKDGGDGACDFKRGQYFTNSYCYYEGYHKTNLVGASDSNMQYNITYHHNYWKDCESRGPLVRQANVHMYNNVFEGQTSYCMNPRANAYIFSEYNVFNNCKNPMQIKSGAIKSYNDVFTNCKGDQDGTIVTDKSTVVSSECLYASFELDSSLCYVASGDYKLDTDTSSLLSIFETDGGCMDEDAYSLGSGSSDVVISTTTTETSTTTQTTTTTTTTTTETTVQGSDDEVSYGDVNCDGTVNIADVLTLNKNLLAGEALTAQGALNADVDKDNVPTSADALNILKYTVKLIDTLPI